MPLRILRGDRLYAGPPAARPARGGGAGVDGPPPGDEPGERGELPDGQSHAGALPRRAAREGRGAAASGAQPARGPRLTRADAGGALLAIGATGDSGHLPALRYAPNLHTPGPAPG